MHEILHEGGWWHERARSGRRAGICGVACGVGVRPAFPGTIGFDINVEKVAQLRQGIDRTGEVSSEQLKSAPLHLTCDLADLKSATFFVVAVPTPVDVDNRPDLTPVFRASETVGKVLKRGDVVVYESTVYPGVTEDLCGPLLAEV